MLKRGCTEFELFNFGDSAKWGQTDEQEQWEKIVWEKFEVQPFWTMQTDEVKHEVKEEWFRHAHHAGDPTAVELNGGPLYPVLRTYHKELYESVKKKRAVKRALKGK